MRIVTLNTWKNEGHYATRLRLMAEGLATLDPDVVCLQEAFSAKGFDTAATLGMSLGLHVAAQPARAKPRRTPEGWIESASGLAILSRTPVTETVRIALSSDPRDGERIAQLARLASDISVLNLHLTHLSAASPLRARQLAEALDGARSWDGQLIVAGDLNAAADAPELATLEGHLDRNAPGTLQGPRADRARTGPAIDHVALLRPGRWRIARRFNALDQPDTDGWFASDHAAVVADLVCD